MFGTVWKWLVNGIALFLVVSVVLFIGILLTREYFLWRGVLEFHNALIVLQRMDGGSQCTEEYGDTLVGSPLQQIRFEDSRRYYLEVVCPGFRDRPVLSQPRILASFVSKKPGNSGIIIDPENPSNEYVALTVFGEIAKAIPEKYQPFFGWLAATKLVGIEGSAIVEKSPSQVPIIENVGPLTVCEGYGYSCCDALTEVGLGSAVENLNSCEGGCFEQCLTRPVVIALQSNPLMEWDQRAVKITSGASVEFSFTGQDVSSNAPWVTTIDFGDGTSDELAELEGKVSHTYTCPNAPCQYTARARISNVAGATSTDSPTSTMVVIVE